MSTPSLEFLIRLIEMQPRRMRNSHRVNHKIPLYARVQDSIQEKIENVAWKPGQAIPTEIQLAETFEVSLGTVKKALTNLINEGFLFRVQGKGTFVAGNMVTRENLRYYPFLKDFNAEEALFTPKILSLKTIKYPKYLIPLFKLGLNDRVFKLERLFLIENKPLIYCVGYYPEKLFPGMEAFLEKQFERIALFTFIEKKYSLPTLFNHELISAIAANVRLAKLLQVDNGSPLLQNDMISYTYKDMPFEYRISYATTHKLKLFREI